MAPDNNCQESSSVHTVYLVACVKEKVPGPVPAKDLYISPWFRLARAYVEAQGQPWFILSAKYGLVDPCEELCDYDETLNTMKVAERREWAKRVIDEMEQRLPEVDHIVVLAGKRYREFLMDYLRKRASTVEVPMKHLRIGEQLSWLGRQNA